MSQEVEKADDAVTYLYNAYGNDSAKDEESFSIMTSSILFSNEGSKKDLQNHVSTHELKETHLNNTPKRQRMKNKNMIFEFLAETVRELGPKLTKYSDRNVQEKKSSLDENNLAMNLSVNSNKRPNDNFFRNPNVSDVTNRFYVKELENKGIVRSTTKLIHSNEYSEENEYQKLFDDGLSYFNKETFRKIFFCRRDLAERDEENPNLKRNHSSDGFTRQPISQQEIDKKPNIKTLEDSLKYFDLSSEILTLETSLEEVRKNRKNKNILKHHQDCFKKIVKKIQMLSFEYHPDKIQNKGGTQSEIATAQNLQTALNALKTALIFLNSAFIEDIGTDHHFGFYTKLSLSTVCNEEQMKEHIFEVILKIDMISQIKQQYIISEIRKFLIESKNCIRSYLARKFNDYISSRDAALLQLEYCIKGFEKLIIEIKEVKQKCKSEGNDENMLSALQCMASKTEKDFKLLQSLETTAKESLEGKCQFFSPEEVMDSYFVLPLVSYTNVILMCNVMVRKTSFFHNFFYTEPHPRYKEDLQYLMHSFYLASYYSGNKSYKYTVITIMNKKKEREIRKEEIKSQFNKHIKDVSEKMEIKFIVDDYPEASTSNSYLKKCLLLMKEFYETEKEVLNMFEDLKKKTKKMNEESEEFVKTMKAAEEQNQKVQERLEQSKKFREMVSNSLSEQL